MLNKILRNVIINSDENFLTGLFQTGNYVKIFRARASISYSKRSHRKHALNEEKLDEICVRLEISP
jgi:hypothetical protein